MKMTHIPILSLAFILVAVLMVVNFTRSKIKTVNSQTNQAVSLAPRMVPSAVPSPAPSSNESSTPAPTIFPTPTNFASTTPKNSSSSSSINDWLYPNSSVDLKTSLILNLESSDDANNITNWYKDKMKNMNAKSFITTTTNGNILNKLAAANTSGQVKVEVNKPANSNAVKIFISLE